MIAAAVVGIVAGVCFLLVILRGGLVAKRRAGLNGWQKLWRGLVLLWFAVHATLLYFSDDWPRASRSSGVRVHDSLYAAGQWMEATQPGFRSEGVHELRRQRYAGLSDEQVVGRLHAEFGSVVDFSRIEARYRHEIDDIAPKQVRMIGMLAGYWNSVCAMLFALEAWAPQLFQRLRRRQG